MSDFAIEMFSLVLGSLMYFGGLLVWPTQACVRHRWDKLSKALAVVCGIHVVLLVVATALTDAFVGSDAHHAWWLFVLLNLISVVASLMAWVATSSHHGKELPKQGVNLRWSEWRLGASVCRFWCSLPRRHRLTGR